MRPRKVILLVHHDEDAMALLAYMLDVQRYHVLRAAKLSEARRFLARNLVDTVLVAHQESAYSGDSIIQELKSLRSYVPMVLLANPRAFKGRLHHADRFLDAARTSNQDILACLKETTARKRGPRKGSFIATIKQQEVTA